MRLHIHMDANQIIELATDGIEAALKIIASVKAQSGMSDDEIIAAAQTENDASKAAITNYLAAL